MNTDTTALATTAKDALMKSLTLGKTDLASFCQPAKQSIMLVDCSASMSDRMADGTRKVDATRTAVTMIRDVNPVPMANIGGPTRATDWLDTIPEPSGMTPLHTAIRFGKASGANHLIVVTDGQPDSESMAFDAAREFAGVIDVFYIGDGNDIGAKFAKRLAAMTGGTANIEDLLNPKLLAGKVIGLLGA